MSSGKGAMGGEKKNQCEGEKVAASNSASVTTMSSNSFQLMPSTHLASLACFIKFFFLNVHPGGLQRYLKYDKEANRFSF